MWAAGALRGSPPSTTITDRRDRASINAPARPAAEPPITTTSHQRWNPFESLMSETVEGFSVFAERLAEFARLARRLDA